MGICAVVITVAPQPYGPTEQQLATPDVHQEFCMYPRNKYILPSVQTLKTIQLPESEQCTMFCTLEPDCFLTEYNPTNGNCKMYTFYTGCGNYRNGGHEMVYSWKTSFTPQNAPPELCQQHAFRSDRRGGGCLAKTNQTRQHYSDKEYFQKYGAITAVALWKKGHFRAVQFKYEFK